MSARQYIHELDLLRAYTACTVVILHTMLKMTYLVTSVSGTQFLYLLMHLLHYNREVFVFITALVLTYIYQAKPGYSIKQFYRGRGIIVFIPYLVWTVLYTFKNQQYATVLGYVGAILENIVSGNASPQLYYILLTLQLYLVFPLILPVMRRLALRPFRALAISLAFQLIYMALDYRYIQAGPLTGKPLVYFFGSYHDMLLLSYQFFVLLGGLAAFHMQAIRDWFAGHGRLVLLVSAITLVGYIAYYFLAVLGWHQDIAYATSVLQPSVVLYSTVAIGFFGWVALQWSKRQPAGRFIKSVADISFGLFFVHFFFLDFMSDHFGPAIMRALPAPLGMVVAISIVLGLSLASCYVLFKIPFLSWTIGKPAKRPIAP